jgi:hypothetical protein
MGPLSWRESEREEWQEVVAATGGYVVGETNGWGVSPRVEAPVDGGSWRKTITLDLYTVPVMVGKVFVPMPFARAVAPFPVSAQGEGLHLSVGRSNPFTGIGKLSGMQDIEVGNDAFDRAFVVKGNDPKRVRELLAGEPGNPLREMLERLPGICPGVSNEGREATAYATGKDEAVAEGNDVVYAVMGAAGSEELVALFNVAAETLRGLHRIGSAGEAEPIPGNPAEDGE